MEQLNENYLLGTKLFKYDENDNLEVIRIVGRQNERVLRTINIKTGQKKKMTIPMLKDEYNILKPDGYINFNIVNYYASGTDKLFDDVLIILNRYKDLVEGDNRPYVICRQNVADLHSNMINNTSNIYRGCSISKDTCPNNVELESYLYCNDLLYTETVCCYIGDGIKDILQCIKLKKFDTVLNSIYEEFVSELVGNQKEVAKNTNKYLGYCRSLNELLYNTNFMDDYFRAFGILKVNNKICLNHDGSLDPFTIKEIENEIGHEIIQYTCVLYDKDIELENISANWKLITDWDYDNNDVYLLVYTKPSDNTISDEQFISNEEKLNIIDTLTNI